jgi:hypothetical protein
VKLAVEDALLMRGSRDFDTIADYRRFVDELIGRRNARNRKRIDAERAVLRPLPPRRAEDGEEAIVTVTSSGGFKKNGQLPDMPKPRLVPGPLLPCPAPPCLPQALQSRFGMSTSKRKRPGTVSGTRNMTADIKNTISQEALTPDQIMSRFTVTPALAKKWREKVDKELNAAGASSSGETTRCKLLHPLPPRHAHSHSHATHPTRQPALPLWPRQLTLHCSTASVALVRGRHASSMCFRTTRKKTTTPSRRSCRGRL